MSITTFKYSAVAVIAAGALVSSVWLARDPAPAPGNIIPAPTPSAAPSLNPQTSRVLPVPYINEAPSGNWTGPWKNACEEASITMVEFYYRGRKSVTIREAEEFMSMLFAKQDKLYGSNVNADAEQLVYLIENFTSFKGVTVRNPTIEQIKAEIDDERPVISPHYGFALNNPNIPFLRTGTSYHMMVIIGYDDERRQFIVNDDGDTKAGASHRYGYDLFRNSLHDFSHERNKADGPPTVVFTSPKG